MLLYTEPFVKIHFLPTSTRYILYFVFNMLISKTCKRGYLGIYVNRTDSTQTHACTVSVLSRLLFDSIPVKHCCEASINCQTDKIQHSSPFAKHNSFSNSTPCQTANNSRSPTGILATLLRPCTAQIPVNANPCFYVAEVCFVSIVG